MKFKVDTNKVYIAMIEKGMNGTDLAKAAGVTQQAVSNVLNGKNLGKAKTLPAICKVLDLQVKDIVIIE